MSVSDEMWSELSTERTTRRLGTIQEVIRNIVADYLVQRDRRIQIEDNNRL
jgi:hypothetical protein